MSFSTYAAISLQRDAADTAQLARDLTAKHQSSPTHTSHYLATMMQESSATVYRHERMGRGVEESS